MEHSPEQKVFHACWGKLLQDADRALPCWSHWFCSCFWRTECTTQSTVQRRAKKDSLLKCNTQFMFIRSLFRTLSLGSNFFNSGSESRIVCNIGKHALSSSNSNIQLAKLHFKLLPTWTASGRQMSINWGGNVPSALLWEINSNALLFPDLVWCQNKNYSLRTLNIGFKAPLASTKRWYVVKLPWSMTSITDRSRLYASLACTFANRCSRFINNTLWWSRCLYTTMTCSQQLNLIEKLFFHLFSCFACLGFVGDTDWHGNPVVRHWQISYICLCHHILFWKFRFWDWMSLNKFYISHRIVLQALRLSHHSPLLHQLL